MMDLQVLNTLNDKEKEYALKILSELNQGGTSEALNQLIYADYDEIPVDIHTFLHDPQFLGQALTNEEGKFTLFPYWEGHLAKIFPTNVDTVYDTAILTGQIGIGKSTDAVVGILYQLYRLMCLKDPYLHYGLQPTDLITVAFMNITLDAAKGVAWDKCQQMLHRQPWFMARGTLSKGLNETWQPPKGIELICGSLPRHVIGRCLFACFVDEVSFQPTQDINKQIEKAKLLVSTIQARMQSRFMKGEKNPTILFLAQSKRTEQSFLETFIETKKKNNSKTTLIVDEPQWVVRTDKDSPNKFKVAVGNKFLSSEVLPLGCQEELIQTYRNRGYRILDVPMGYYSTFIDDIDIALTDVAGISTKSSNAYFSGERITKIKHVELKNPFIKEILEVGNAPDDTLQYKDFFDLSLIPSGMKGKPLYIHLDMSINGDKTGIAGTWQKGKRPPMEGTESSKELIYQLAFAVAIKAPKGHQISFEKTRNFIYWLKEQGFNIKFISQDTFQSASTLQELSAKGFNTGILSVDRLQDRICIPYAYLKSTIYEERLLMFEHKLLTDELIGLQRDNNTGKIDHSPQSINCFTGDTKVSLIDGRQLQFIELCEEHQSGKCNYVYSINPATLKIEPKPILNAWCSGHNAKLIEVVLDNGEHIKCTPEHRFMLRDGTYCEAQHLIMGDSLMPLYTKISGKGLAGYRLYYEPMDDCWHYEHRQFATEIADEHFLVHHKDFNKLNNSPDNLIWCSKAKHQKFHCEENTGAYSPEANFKRQQSVKKQHEDAKNQLTGWMRYYKGTEEDKLIHHSQVQKRKKLQQQKIDEISQLFSIDFVLADNHTKRRCVQKYVNLLAGKNVCLDLNQPDTKQKKELALNKQQQICAYYGMDRQTLSSNELQGLAIKYLNETQPGYTENISNHISENHKKGIYKNAAIALQKCNEKKHAEALERYSASDAYKEILEINKIFNIDWEALPANQKISYKHRYHNMLKKDIVNHKVVAINVLNITEDVYDIEVQDNHNFALASGVFVHNSKDIADALAGSVYQASQYVDEFAFDYGEDLSIVLETNTSNGMELNKQQVTLDYEQEMKLAFQNAFNDIASAQQNVQTNNQILQEKQKQVDLMETLSCLNDGILLW